VFWGERRVDSLQYARERNIRFVSEEWKSVLEGEFTDDISDPEDGPASYGRRIMEICELPRAICMARLEPYPFASLSIFTLPHCNHSLFSGRRS
jgi:hypothetical protein